MSSPRPRTVLGAEGLVLVREGRRILNGVDFQARSGEITLVTGRSGSGKSSLLSLLGGLERADQGSVSLDGRPVAPEHRDVRARFGLVLQGYGLLSLLTAAENIDVALFALRWDEDAVAERTEELLDRLGLLDSAEHLLEQLSGGQQQRVAVARALAARPDVILADEPTAELDPVTRRIVLGQLHAAAEAGAVVVIATHDTELRSWGAHEVVLDDGVVVEAYDLG